MAISKKALQKKLDFAAAELENAGHKDLAAKVDYYCDRLMAVKTAGEVSLIHRAISRIHAEAKKRVETAASLETQTAKESVRRARRVSDSKKELLQRRIANIVARRKKAAAKLAGIKDKRDNRLAGSKSRRNARNKRIKSEE